MEQSTRPPDDLVADLTGQSASLGWTADRPGYPLLNASVKPDVKRPAATRYKGDRELEVWLSPLDRGTEVRLVVSTGVAGIVSCY